MLTTTNGQTTGVRSKADLRISVVIPCYNAEAYIRQAIQSALEQTLPPLEILVIDDASTDRSVEVAASFGFPIRVIRQAKNKGAAVARNVGIRLAHGDWIAFLDADDLWNPDKLEKQLLAVAGTGGHVVGVITDMYWFGPDGVQKVDRPNVSDLEGDFHVKLLYRCLTGPSTALVRADIARTILFPEGMRNVEDQQFFVKLRKCGPILYVPEALTGYRRWPGQLTAKLNHIVNCVRGNMVFLQTHHDWYTPAEIGSPCLLRRASRPDARSRLLVAE